MSSKHAGGGGGRAAGPTLLVTGGSGALGRRVVELLMDGRHGTVRAATRKPEKLGDLEARGAQVVRCDFDDRASLAAAMAGVERVLIVSTESLGVPGKRFAQHQAAIEAARKARVAHVVYTSLVRPEAGSPVTLAEDHRRTEEALVQSGLHHTVLRNNLYVENLLMVLPQAVRTGVLASATDSGAAAYVAREDCARAAAAVLAAHHPRRGTFDITGPVAFTHADIAALAARISGRPAVHQNVSLVDVVEAWGRMGLPPAAATELASIDIGVAQGWFAGISHAFTDLTGRVPRSASELLAARLPALIKA